jgi:hypothetical protein
MSEGRQLTIDGTALLHDIRERGMTLMDHGIPDERVDELIATYTSFTLNHPDPSPSTMDAMLPRSEPDELAHQLDDLDRSQDTQSEWHKYRTNHDWVGKPGGYSNRTTQVDALKRARGVELGDDPKEFYHYSPGGMAAIERQHKDFDWGKVPSEVYDLHSAFQPIHAAGMLIMRKTLALVEETHPEIKDIVNAQSLLGSPVRLLFYHPDQGSQLGAAHYDKSTMTIQFAESHKGLRIAASPEHELEVVERPPEKCAVFASKGLITAIPDTPYKPGWHDIIQISDLNEGRTLDPRTAEVCARWAIIFFSNSANYVQPPKHETHTR